MPEGRSAASQIMSTHYLIQMAKSEPFTVMQYYYDVDKSGEAQRKQSDIVRNAYPFCGLKLELRNSTILETWLSLRLT